MTDTEIITGLWRLAVMGDQELKCLGCGHEHSCSLHVCQIIKAAAHRLTELSNPRTDPIPYDAAMKRARFFHDGSGVVAAVPMGDLMELAGLKSPHYPLTEDEPDFIPGLVTGTVQVLSREDHKELHDRGKKN